MHAYAGGGETREEEGEIPEEEGGVLTWVFVVGLGFGGLHAHAETPIET